MFCGYGDSIKKTMKMWHAINIIIILYIDKSELSKTDLLDLPDQTKRHCLYSIFLFILIKISWYIELQEKEGIHWITRLVSRSC